MFQMEELLEAVLGYQIVFYGFACAFAVCDSFYSIHRSLLFFVQMKKNHCPTLNILK